MARSKSAAGKSTVVVLDDNPLIKPTQPAKPQPKPGKSGWDEAGTLAHLRRLGSIDAYRGLVMIAMASGALGFASIVANQHGAPPPPAAIAADGAAPSWWGTLWTMLAYQFEHVPWVGCTFWDLIQPSFMFIVGAAMPFSFAKRTVVGHGALRRWLHVLFRALVLIALGVFLSSNNATQTNFTYVNVLTQIGLGYVFVYLLLNRGILVQGIAAAVILIGTWCAFFFYTPDDVQRQAVAQYLVSDAKKAAKCTDVDRGPWAQEGIAWHWNKHTNFAAAADRWLLNQTPRAEAPWSPDGEAENARPFWTNEGGYQTLNFIPSMATMLFGVMAGQLLLSGRRRKVLTLVAAGAVCFVVVLALDTTIWPVKWHSESGSLVLCASGLGDPAISASELLPNWTICPTVKRIWTPTWAIFSTGWTLWLLAAFYLVIDVWGFQAWAFPLKVVGMNSIAMYVMAQLIKPWTEQTIKTHLGAVSAVTGTDLWGTVFAANAAYGPLWSKVAVLLVLWLACLWMYRQRIFVRI